MNLSINLWSDSSFVWRKLAKVVDVRPCNLLITYWELKHSTRVSKLPRDQRVSLSYHVNVAPLRDIGKTQHMIASLLV